MGSRIRMTETNDLYLEIAIRLTAKTTTPTNPRKLSTCEYNFRILRSMLCRLFLIYTPKRSNESYPQRHNHMFSFDKCCAVSFVSISVPSISRFPTVNHHNGSIRGDVEEPTFHYYDTNTNTYADPGIQVKYKFVKKSRFNYRNYKFSPFFPFQKNYEFKCIPNISFYGLLSLALQTFHKYSGCLWIH